jgi:hypothetical protein
VVTTYVVPQTAGVMAVISRTFITTPSM